VSRPAGPAWLYSARFDLTFVAGTASLALLAAVAVGLSPSLFSVILIADLWLLGYHHVIGTFTRLTFDRESFKRYLGLVTWLPLVVIASVVALAWVVGTWVLPTIYLYWQWWHYTRQSYGVAQMYRVKNGESSLNQWELKALIYALPLAGLLNRSHQDPAQFLGMELRLIWVPEAVVMVAGGIAVASIALWTMRQFQAMRRGTPAWTYSGYLLTHVVVFTTGYFLLPNIDHGWLALNIWHNSQYLLVVWMFNNKRFKDQVSQEHPFLSKLSQRGNVLKFFGTTLALSTAAYLTLASFEVALASTALPLAVVVYQVINFHHYIVDSVIWKVRKPQMRADLGLKQAA
jgi:hypothetical protein